MKKLPIRSVSLLLTFGLTLFLPSKAKPQETVATPVEIVTSNQNPWGIEIHGFASQGFMFTTENNFLMESKRGSFEFSEVGINFTKQLTERLRTGVQLFSQKLGNIGNFRVIADWFYLDYKFSDEFGLRAGRVKIPFGLYNDTSDIDAARVPVLLPQSIYTITSRNFLLAQTGGELYGRLNFNSAGSLEYRFYGGAINLDIPQETSSRDFIDYKNPYLVGGRLLWETPLEGLRLGGSMQALRLDAEVVYSAAPTTAVHVEIPALLTVGSAEFSKNNWLFAAEYSRWYLSIDSDNNTLLPSRPSYVAERGYGMLSYRFNQWFQPGAYVSIYYPDADKRSGRENRQHDYAATLRFDINPYWLVKLEGHFVHGTAGLNPSLNDGTPPSAMHENWFMTLVKTTVYF